MLRNTSSRPPKFFLVILSGAIALAGFDLRAADDDVPAERQVDPPPAGKILTIPYSDEKLRELARPKVDPPDTRQSEGLQPPDAAARVFGDLSTPLTLSQARPWAEREFHWLAAELTHRPLYFEDVMLERHGHSRPPIIQHSASAARFFLSFTILPYKMQLDPPHRQLSTLGHYRPGSGAPDVFQRPRFRWDAALVEAAAWTGVGYWVP
ncbi:MAG: hypothetical protein QF805_25215 [Pirellulaceae bacterium]|jgi:hypothetical protein|nr:hypothetical protein [Pirellulaceae bacterium]